MKTLISKIKQFYKNKEEEKVGDKFIQIMEIIYAIILACGVVKIVEIIQKDFPCIARSTKFSIAIAIFVLVRFFFAPSKNIKILGKESIGWKWSIMIFDVPFLIIHSFIYCYMCSQINDPEKFYLSFFTLLIFNSIWLFFIWFRLRSNKGIRYIKIWAISNLVFFLLYLGTPIIHWNFWVPWFIFAITNSIIDLGTTYADYFRD